MLMGYINSRQLRWINPEANICANSRPFRDILRRRRVGFVAFADAVASKLIAEAKR